MKIAPEHVLPEYWHWQNWAGLGSFWQLWVVLVCSRQLLASLCSFFGPKVVRNDTVTDHSEPLGGHGSGLVRNGTVIDHLNHLCGLGPNGPFRTFGRSWVRSVP